MGEAFTYIKGTYTRSSCWMLAHPMALVTWTSTNPDRDHAADQVSESMRTQAREMAENNLAQEQVMGELRNQIAIIR